MSVKVSICVPTYNNVDEVEHLLHSIFMQSYQDYEVVISDDSTNLEIKQLIEEQYPQVRYVHNEKPLGHIFNWNAAIKMAQGEYVKIMFSDDWFTFQDSLEQLVELLEKHPEADLAFCGSRQVKLSQEETRRYVEDWTKETQEKVVLEQGKDTVLPPHMRDRYASEAFVEALREDYRALFMGNQIGAPSAILYRREPVLHLFDEKSNWASDMFLYFDILKDNPHFVVSTKPLISIGEHEMQYTESFSEKDERIYLDYKYMYTKYQLGQDKRCTEYLLEKYLIPYGYGYREAKSLGIANSLYWQKKRQYLGKVVKCFIENRRN